jgi:hypothetical protein
VTSTTSRTRTPTVLLAVGGGSLAASVVAYLVMTRLEDTAHERIHARCATGQHVHWDKGYPLVLPIATVILPAFALIAAVAVIWLGRRADVRTVVLLVVAVLLTLFGLLYLSDYLAYSGGEQGAGDPCGEGAGLPMHQMLSIASSLRPA